MKAAILILIFVNALDVHEHPATPCPKKSHRGIVYLNKPNGPNIKNVEIFINGNGGCVSDDMGNFIYSLNDCPGSGVRIQIKKDGYDIVNQIEVQKHILKNITQNDELQFTLILSKNQDLLRYREEYYRAYLGFNTSYIDMQHKIDDLTQQIRTLQRDRILLERSQRRYDINAVEFKDISQRINNLTENIVILSNSVNRSTEYLNQKRDQADQLVKILSRISTSDVDSSYNRAFVLFKEGKYKEVQNVLSSTQMEIEIEDIQAEKDAIKKIEEEFKKRKRNYVNKALLKAAGYQSIQNIDSTIYWYRQALKVDSTQYNALFSLATYLQKKNKYDEALNSYSKALQLAKTESSEKKTISDIYNNIGLIYMNKNSFPEAIENLQKAINLKKDIFESNNLSSSLPWFQSTANLARVFFKNDDFHEAFKIIGKPQIELFNQLSNNWARNRPRRAHDRDLAQAFGNLAWYNILVGDYSKAEDLSRQGLKLDPSQQWIETNLAHSLLLQNDFTKAEIVYDRLVDKKYTNGNVLNNTLLKDFSILEKIGVQNANMELIKNKVMQVN